MDDYKSYKPKMVALSEPIRKENKIYHLAFSHEEDLYYIMVSDIVSGKITWLYKSATWSHVNAFFEGLK